MCWGIESWEIFLDASIFHFEFIQVFYYAYTGLSYNNDDYEKNHNLPENTYTKEYGAMIISCLICGAFFTFTGIL